MRDNHDLRRKFDRKATFFQEMQGVSKRYSQFEQQVLYSPVTNLNPQMIVRVEREGGGRIFGPAGDLYIINGQFQPAGNDSFERLVLQIVQSIPR